MGYISIYFIKKIEWGHSIHPDLQIKGQIKDGFVILILIQYANELAYLALSPIYESHSYEKLSSYILKHWTEFGLVIYFYAFRQCYLTFVFRVIDQVINQLLIQKNAYTSSKLRMQERPVMNASTPQAHKCEYNDIDAKAPITSDGTNVGTYTNENTHNDLDSEESKIVLHAPSPKLIPMAVIIIAISVAFDSASIFAEDSASVCVTNNAICAAILFTSSLMILELVFVWQNFPVIAGKNDCCSLVTSLLTVSTLKEHWAILLVLVVSIVSSVGIIGEYVDEYSTKSWSYSIIAREIASILSNTVQTLVIVVWICVSSCQSRWCVVGSRVSKDVSNKINGGKLVYIGYLIWVLQIYMLMHAFIMDASHLKELTEHGSHASIWIKLDVVCAWAKFELHLSTLERLDFIEKKHPYWMI